jgi:hypothetical protein
MALVALLYAGLARRKSALSLIWAVSAANAVVIFQWYFWGYSLAFSSTATNGFIGNLKNFALKRVLADPSPGSPLLPELLYSFYQMEFACVTVAILMGGIAERGRVFPAMVFTFIWMTLVYCPLACWAWAPNGWGFKYGVLDFAGKSLSRKRLDLSDTQCAQGEVPSKLAAGLLASLTRGSWGADRRKSSSTSDRTMFPSSCLARLCCGSVGLGSMAGVLLAPICAP